MNCEKCSVELTEENQCCENGKCCKACHEKACGDDKDGECCK